MYVFCLGGWGFLCFGERCFLGKVLLADTGFVLKGKSDLKNITELFLFLQALETASLGSLTWG